MTFIYAYGLGDFLYKKTKKLCYTNTKYWPPSPILTLSCLWLSCCLHQQNSPSPAWPWYFVLWPYHVQGYWWPPSFLNWKQTSFLGGAGLVWQRSVAGARWLAIEGVGEEIWFSNYTELEGVSINLLCSSEVIWCQEHSRIRHILLQLPALWRYPLKVRG